MIRLRALRALPTLWLAIAACGTRPRGLEPHTVKKTRAALFRRLATMLLVLGACSPTAMLARWEREPPAQLGLFLIGALEGRRLADVTSHVTPELLTPDAHAYLRTVVETFPPQAGPTHLVGYHSNHTVGTGTQYRLTYESAYPDRHVVTSMVLFDPGGDLKLHAIQAQANPTSLAKLNELTLAGRSARHYLFALGALGFPALSVAALVRWTRQRKVLARKWLWFVAILFGVGKVSLSWTTGAIDIAVAQMQLLGAGITREGIVGPWWLSLSLPVGALVFLLRKPAPAAAVPPVTPAGDT